MKTEITEKEKEWIVERTSGKVKAKIHIPKEICRRKEDVTKYIEGEKDR